MASAALSRRVRKVVGYPPLCDMGDLQRREFPEALLDADSFEDLPGRWQAAIVKAEQKRPNLRIVSAACSCPSWSGSPARRLRGRCQVETLVLPRTRRGQRTRHLAPTLRATVVLRPDLSAGSRPDPPGRSGRAAGTRLADSLDDLLPVAL